MRALRNTNDTLAPPGERVRVRGYPQSIFVLTVSERKTV
jgi:hypothetical protein